MTQQTLYSLRSQIGLDGDGYFITKFVDGEVESTYNVTLTECDCPAGHRHTCRHRQMLPQMLAHGLANTHWFWDYDRGYACDFQGGSKQLADEVVSSLSAGETEEDEDTMIDGLERDEITQQPHSPTATTADFDSADAGSIPAGVANRGWRRL